jgi:glucose/arabinose dehydrogenase
MPLPRLLLLVLATGFPLVAQSPPLGFTYETLVDGPLQSATAMAFLPDGRLLLTERMSGHIRLFANGSLQPAPWATVPTNAGGSFSEAGLLGIAVDPGFLTNRYVYVFFTDASGNQSQIARLVDNGGVGTNLTVLNPANSLPGSLYHNGGAMVFGPDGTLFVATGDALGAANAQDPFGWLGKVLRFEVPNLTVPANNPFSGSPVFSLGHRNQFGLTIHPITGLLYQTENGTALMDELNVILPGGNYGWPLYEGTEPVQAPAYVDPLFVLQPTVAPTGTCFYSGDLYPPAYRNGWFFADYNMNRLRMLTLDATGVQVQGQQLFDTLPGSGYAVLTGPDGNLWMLTNDAGGFGADELGRYVYSQAPLPSAQLSAVSNKVLGGSLTVGVTATNGDIVVPWLSLGQLPAPVPTPFGDVWVLADALLPALAVQADSRVYHGLSVPNVPALLGGSVHLQAIALSPSGAVLLSNPSQVRVRG